MAEDQNLREQMLAQGTAWLMEMEFLDSKQAKNFLYLNTYNADPQIKDVELLLDTQYRIMLVWIKLGWWGRLLRKQKEIEQYLLEQYQNILPSFRVRIVYDRRIFDLALKKAEELAKGGPNAKSKVIPVDPVRLNTVINQTLAELNKHQSIGTLGPVPRNPESLTAPTTKALGDSSARISDLRGEAVSEVQGGVETVVVNPESGVVSPQGPTKLPDEEG